MEAYGFAHTKHEIMHSLQGENTSNHIVGCNIFPAMGAMKKVGPCRILGLATM
jgi:hypothetical protein